MDHFDELTFVLRDLDRDRLNQLKEFVQGTEGTLWICGNGGSMSTAQHWACDLQKVAQKRIITLGSNPAIVTAWSNDIDYDFALAAELQYSGREGDRLICLSCSGKSQNIRIVLEQAKEMKMRTAAVVGVWGIPSLAVDLIIHVPSMKYGLIEDVHLAIGHWLTEELRA